jgi:predicted TIM-barrel fold metal-dependent hydrolase
MVETSSMTEARPKAIDCWLNPAFRASDYRPDFLVRVARDYFHREKEMFEVTPLEELLRQMDVAGVERAILTIDPHDPAPYHEVRRAFPDRFILSAMLDPMGGMGTIRLLERAVTQYDVRLVRVTPFLVNRPPNDKVYYPIYAKCIELGIPISVNTGIPGPPMPAEPQRPLHLDEVCLFYPELVLIMAHGADPWWGEAIRLLLKYPNLYMMTSAYAPKYLPPELIQFMNTRGQGKILFASDHPVLSFERCLAEAAELPLRDGVLARYLYENARAVFRWD